MPFGLLRGRHGDGWSVRHLLLGEGKFVDSRSWIEELMARADVGDAPSVAREMGTRPEGPFVASTLSTCGGAFPRQVR